MLSLYLNLSRETLEHMATLVTPALLELLDLMVFLALMAHLVSGDWTEVLDLRVIG